MKRRKKSLTISFFSNMSEICKYTLSKLWRRAGLRALKLICDCAFYILTKRLILLSVMWFNIRKLDSIIQVLYGVHTSKVNIIQFLSSFFLFFCYLLYYPDIFIYFLRGKSFIYTVYNIYWYLRWTTMYDWIWSLTLRFVDTAQAPDTYQWLRAQYFIFPQILFLNSRGNRRVTTGRGQDIRKVLYIHV